MNDMRTVLNCIYLHPWQTVNQICERTKLTNPVVNRLIKKDLNLDAKKEEDGKRTMTKYALYPVTF